jgi:PAS domain S-box-containing protein
MKNITERRMADKSLSEQEKAWRDIASSLAEGIYVMNQEGNIVFINPEAERLLGWTMSELNNRNAHDVIHYMKADGSPLPFKECRMHKVIENGIRFVSSDEVFVRKGGMVFPVSVICSPVIENNQIIASVTAFRGITEQKNMEQDRENLIFDLGIANKALKREIAERMSAEENLRQSEERFRLAMLGATDGLWDRNLQTDEIYYSPRWKTMLGYTDEELENHIDTWKSLLHPDDRESTLALVRDFTEGRADKYEVEFRLRHKNGHYLDILSRGSLIRGVSGEALRLVGTHVDLSEIKKAEEEIRSLNKELEQRVIERTAQLEAINRTLQDEITRHKKSQENLREMTSELNKSNEQLRNLAAHLQYVREEERIKIAREIHDELGQTLSAQKMELSWFRDRYGDHKPIFDKVGAMLDAINATMRSVRRICTELRPSILDDFGIVDAMQWHANEFQTRTRIECAVDSAPEDIKLDKERSTALFRIFQETLTNVLKHARATKVTARLTKDYDNITLEVIDNGKGITEEQLSKPQSFGLMGMRERVYPWGGKVEVTGHKNKGTKVKVSIPHLV